MPTLAECHALLASNRALIAETWNFFMSVHMGLFAAILFSPSYETNRSQERRRFHLLLLLPFYVGFSYLNYHAQLDNYSYANTLLSYTAKLESENAQGLKLVDISFQRGWLIPFLGPIYIACGSFSAILILAASIVRPRSRNGNALAN